MSIHKDKQNTTQKLERTHYLIYNMNEFQKYAEKNVRFKDSTGNFLKGQPTNAQ